MFQVREHNIRGGDEGFVVKAAQMVEFARHDAVSQDFWPVAYGVLEAARFPADNNEVRRAQAIYDHLRRFEFVVSPPLASQYLLRPRALESRRMGDCTAFATFISACAGVYGFKSSFMYCSTAPSGEWEHTWTRVFFPARQRHSYVDVDPSYRRSGARFGWAISPDQCTRLVEVEVM